MRYLLDTHVLLWFLLGEEKRFSPQSIALLLDAKNSLYFSTASIWEIAIKYSLQKPEFNYDPKIIVQELTAQGFIELKIDVSHVIGVTKLPKIHQDPFDRLLICQARQEQMVLLTADKKILQYSKAYIQDIH
ncbi:hypothetical protein A1D29_01870 [Pasteurellaceae bacterium Orientalotternb1]|nr:hypothetical protein A1D29_01870 [Pasteurellaceae bacterium Orientalotternb1]